MSSMRRRQKQLVRVLALGLAVLLLLGTVVSIVFTHDHAHGEENQAADSFAIEVEFLEDAQALQIRQRLLYTNGTGQALDRVEFAVYGNMFRRQSALMYESDVWPDVFPQGNAVGGLEFSQVLFDGEAADWGMLDENELFMRVACDLEPGETGEFLFEYTILLTQNAASLGVGESDWRLRGFYVQPLKFEEGEFVAASPLQQTNYVYADRAEYTFSITLPERYFLAGPGEISSAGNGDGTRTWTLSATGLRELCISFGMRWREYEAETASGTRLRVLASSRQGGPEALDTALAALEAYESWFGPLGWDITIAQSDYALEPLALQGIIWADEDGLFDAMALRRALARQFFGYSAYAMPIEDAWLADSISAYVACLALKEAEGQDAFLDYLNSQIVPEAQYTLPGGLEVTTSAAIFTVSEYESVVLGRGALVMHELCRAMGEESFLDGLRLFYEHGLAMDVVGEYDLVDALDNASGGDWEDFLTDWLFNVADYYVESYTLDYVD